MAKRKVNGAGSIVFDAERNCFRAHCTTHTGRRISKRFSTAKEAQEWVTKTTAAVLNNEFVEPSKMTVGAWLLSYLKDYKAQTVAPKTMDLYTLLAGKCAPIADVRLQSVTAPMIQSFYTELQNTQSVEMVRKVHHFLHAAFEKARRIGLVTYNALASVDPPKRSCKPEIETFTPAEVGAIYKSAQEYSSGRYFPLILLAFSSGARMGELLALFWDCVNFEKDEITIKRNLTVTTSAGTVIGAPKTKAGFRTISIPHTASTRLRELQRSSELVRMNGPVFITSAGTPFTPRNITRAWAQILKRADVPHKKFHVIRHTHATELLAAGAPIADVSRRLGHSKISHTLDLYGHAMPRMDKLISLKVASIFSK